MPINQYIKQVKQRFNAGISTEHSYRSDLQVLLSNLVKGITVTNEPKRQKCGAPDYIIQNKEVPLGYIEAKDIGIDLNKTEKTDQMKRYLASLDNLILTDYLEFRFYKYGSKVSQIKIATIENGRLIAHQDKFSSFETHIKDFCSFTGQTIKSAEQLAKMMAQKAKMMEEVLFNAVKNEDSEDNSLKDQLEAFRQILINDLDEKTFADIYAQTIAYGLFAARLHDETLEDFSRQEARELIPRSNPFLRNLFDYVSGAQLDERVVWIVNDLCEIFRAADLKSILSDFGKSTGQNDPFLHFYETFLAEYDPKLRKSRGVYYTPEPVVNFIVRAVDDILKDEFGLSKGLADTSKVKIKRKVEGTGTKRGKDIYKEEEIHKVQILDPATGTGTFLAETVKQIYSKFKGQEGLWSSYVEKELIPRINGFEILMASYTMCHLKLEMLLNETGYKPKNDSQQPRLKVYLTNSLEEVNQYAGTLFASWLAKESTEANYVKRDVPVMVVIGNPPYANFGKMNQGNWIRSLIADYKKDLNEKKINLDDDYIKFIRYGQHFIDKNGSGILAYISNNSFIDGVTHRQMRKHLLESFDKIYILDLHGSAKKNETALDGSKDDNVFDIQQGVSINIFVKTGKKKKNELGQIFHFDLFGNREFKYSTLNQSDLRKIDFKQISYEHPYYFFVPKQLSDNKYDSWFSLNELFINVNNGVKTDRDSLFIGERKSDIEIRFKTLLGGELAKSFIDEYRVVDSGSFKITERVKGKKYNPDFIKNILYRPFDIRSIYYDPQIVSRPAQKVMQHMLKENIALLSCRQQSTFDFQHILVCNVLSEVCTVSLQTKETTYTFPLYLYPETNEQQTIDQSTARTPNLNPEIIKQIAEKISLTFTPEKEQNQETFAPIDILDYIYAVLHSPTYRERYKEFLKIDFPRVPYPENREKFWQLVKLGGELRTIHLLENPIVEEYITTYPMDGTNIVEKPRYEDGKVYINKEQYFDKVPEIAWNFYIGGYQPAQKWLKDRKGRELSVDDILHYQKIIAALSETYRIMAVIKDLDL